MSPVLDWWPDELPRLIRWLRPTAHDDAPDIADEAILRTWLAERRGATVHPSYAYRVARNLVIDATRRNHYALRRLAAYLAECPQTEPGPETELPSDTLDGLPAWQRLVIAARLRGDRLNEIAEDSGRSLSAVKQAQRRARKRLRAAEQEAQ